jgi:hypothetical protein
MDQVICLRDQRYIQELDPRADYQNHHTMKQVGFSTNPPFYLRLSIKQPIQKKALQPVFPLLPFVIKRKDAI